MAIVFELDRSSNLAAAAGINIGGASLVAQLVKILPAVQETWVWSLGWEDPLEKEMATHSSIIAWKISWTEEPGELQSMGSQRVGHDWATNTYLLTYLGTNMGFPGGSDGKESACNSGDLDLIPGLGRSLEKGMATHSRILAQRIPWAEDKYKQTGKFILFTFNRINHKIFFGFGVRIVLQWINFRDLNAWMWILALSCIQLARWIGAN